jgi:hypothetical protein
MAAVYPDLKFIPMSPDESGKKIVRRVLIEVSKFSKIMNETDLYAYEPEELPEHIDEIMADRAYFNKIIEIVKHEAKRTRSLISELKPTAHVAEVFCSNPYGFSLSVANRLFTELKNPTINLRTIVEYEEFWIDYGLRPTVHVFAFLPNSADTGDRNAKSIKLIRPYCIRDVTYIPPEIALISLYDGYCITHEEINDRNLFHMAIKRYKAHLAELLQGGTSPEFRKVAADMNAIKTSGENIPDDDLYAALSTSGRIVERIVEHQKKTGGGMCGYKSCGDKKKDLIFQIKVDIVQRLKHSALLGSWAVETHTINHDRVQIMSPRGLTYVMGEIRDVLKNYSMTAEAERTHATCVPKELRLTTTYIKLADQQQKKYVIVEYLNTMEYQPMAIVYKKLAIGSVYTLDKFGLLKYIFVNLYTLNTVRSSGSVDISRYIHMVHNMCMMAVKIRKSSADTDGLMGVLVPFAEYRKVTALDSVKHASYAPYEYFNKRGVLKN